MKSALFYLASPFHEKREVERARRRIEGEVGSLFQESFQVSSPEEAGALKPGRYDLLGLAFLTGGTEGVAVKLSLGKPSILFAHQLMNSLPAALEALSALRKRGSPSWLVPVWKEDAARRTELIRGGVKAALRLRGHRMGLLGAPSPWLVYSVVDSGELRRRLGVELVELDIKSLMKGLEIGEEERESARKLLEAAEGSEVPEEEVAKAFAVYRRLKEIFSERGLGSVTVRCFDLIKEAGTTACVALSLMNDEGSTAGCEGDVPAALAMLVAQTITGRPSFMANPALIEGDTVLLAHCTVALGLVERYRLRTHFESGLGVGVAGKLPEGVRATVLRFSPELDRLRAGVGEVFEGRPVREGYCRTQVLLELKGAEKLLRDPMGNHYVLVLEDIMEGLEAFCAVSGVRLERI